MDDVDNFIKALNDLYFEYGCKLGSAANNVVRIDYKESHSAFTIRGIRLIVWNNETQRYVRGK